MFCRQTLEEVMHYSTTQLNHYTDNAKGCTTDESGFSSGRGKTPFLFQSVQANPLARPASYSLATVHSLSWGKQPGSRS